ncbi:MAG: alkene reductase [Gemmatimonadota bacterium]|nr:alkene reductase [Gemmatimonadota bacterium]
MKQPEGAEQTGLFSPWTLGDLELKNRLVMPPLTRNRAPGLVANRLMAEYYAQRASAGLIISEGTQISELGQGYQDTPGIYTEAQRDGWRIVTDAVHAAGGRIFAQLWHVGRVSHSYYHGQTPVGPSAIPVPGMAYTPEGMVPYETPRALSLEEIGEVVEQFRHAAVLARDAGFDGVEVHAANGYLIDQFLRTGSNVRTDRYGGSVENRLRLLREVTEAVVAEWPEGRVGVRLSPAGGVNGASDDDPVATFSAAAQLLNSFPLACLHLVEGPVGPARSDGARVSATEMIRPLFRRTIISTGGYNRQSAIATVEKGTADLIGFGRFFIANPDLPARFRSDAPLNEPHPETFYGGGEKGYTDYPTLP